MIEFSEKQFAFTTKSGHSIIAIARLDTADYNALRAGITADEYGLQELDFNDNDVVIDIGSATGGEALLLASLNRGIKILAFEPLPENIKLLNENIKLNNFGNISTHLLAVAGKSGIIKIYYGDPKTTFGKAHYFIGTSIKNKDRKSINVKATTLEEIFKFNDIQKLKLLKIDAEGDELEILKNTPGYILKRIDWIIGEHHLQKRSEILKATKGLFEDVPCKYQSDSTLGHFKFKRKK